MLSDILFAVAEIDILVATQ